MRHMFLNLNRLLFIFFLFFELAETATKREFLVAKVTV